MARRGKGFTQLSSEESQVQALCRSGKLSKALDELVHMDQLGIGPSSDETYIGLLKLCNKNKALPQAKHVHSHLRRHRSRVSDLVGDQLVVTLANCGALEEAREVFFNQPRRTVLSWRAIICSFANSGVRGREALKLHRCMQEEGLEPDKYTLTSLFKACVSLEEAMELHQDIRRKMLDSDVFLGNRLVTMYGKCGNIFEAENVFNELANRDTMSWTAMLSVYAKLGLREKVLCLFRQMQEEGVGPEQQTVLMTVQTCGTLAEKEDGAFVEGCLIKRRPLEISQALHSIARRKGLASDIFIANTLVSIYGKCGSLASAESIFIDLSECNTVSWNALLSAYGKQHHYQKALQLYRQMQEEDASPDEQTLAITLQACGGLAEKEEAMVGNGQPTKAVSLEIGQALQLDAKRGGLTSDVFVGNTLVSMYGKCGSIREAENIFSGMLQHSVSSWNSMLSAYADCGIAVKSLLLYRQMKEEGMDVDQRTSVIALQACIALLEKKEATVAEEQPYKVLSLEIGHALHADARRRGFTSDVFVGSALVSMYGKCGSIVEAEDIFNRLTHRNVVSWSAMLSAYVEEGLSVEALHLYNQMQAEHITLDEVTLVTALQGCIETGCVGICRQIHFYIVSSGYDTDVVLANTLVHAYGSCASVLDARAIVEQLDVPEIVAWSACIAGYAQEGNFAASCQMYKEMRLAGIQPGTVTFLSLLPACCHAGLVDIGIELLVSMSRDFCLAPDLKHYLSLFDLLGRAGDFKRLEGFLCGLPLQVDVAVWVCLLGACRAHGNLELGLTAFGYAIDLNPKESAAYVMMCNMYIEAGLRNCAFEVEKLMCKECAL